MKLARIQIIWQVDETAKGQYCKLMKWEGIKMTKMQVVKTASWWNWQVDKLYGKLTKQLKDSIASWWNEKVAKWQVDKKYKLTKQLVDEMTRQCFYFNDNFKMTCQYNKYFFNCVIYLLKCAYWYFFVTKLKHFDWMTLNNASGVKQRFFYYLIYNFIQLCILY